MSGASNLAGRRRSLAALIALPVWARRASAQKPPPPAATVVSPDGTAQITRSIPVPKTLSVEAREMLASGRHFAPDGWTVESAVLVEKARSAYPVRIESHEIAGVKVKIVDPAQPSPEKKDRVLINLHGGGFTSDSGSLLESIPIASLTGTRVVAVEYRLAPQFPFPAAVDDAVAVYRKLLGARSSKKIGIFGTSAGAILTAQTVVRLLAIRQPVPAALGFFTGFADFARSGDSRHLYSVRGFPEFKEPAGQTSSAYVGNHDPADPALSPIYADLRGFPPTLCMTGTRDTLLSGTADFHRALLRAGVDAHLMVFDALPHAHWYSLHLPESKEALQAQGAFLDRRLG